MDAGRPVADWRSPAPYVALTKGDRHAFAWEWLRRSPAYRASGCGGDPAEFGLCGFEPADRAVPAARPIWRSEADPSVLAAVAVACPRHDAFNIGALTAASTCCVGDGIEHWLWSDGLRHIRLDVIEGSLRTGPARLDYRIAGCAGARLQAESLVRLIALARTGRLVRALFTAEVRAPRWTLILRTHDALEAGASHRDIAEQLLGLKRMSRWRIETPSYRSRVRRFVDAARRAASTDPRSWLDGSFP